MSTATSSPSRKWVAVAAAAAALVVAALAWRFAGGGGDSRGEEAFGISTSGAPAPGFEQPLADGSKISLAQLKGQVVFLNFWATWCPPCRDEMPSMLQLGRELEQEYPGRFKLVAVSVDEGGWDVVKGYFGGRIPSGTTVALDVEQKATQAYYCAARGKCPDSYKFPETYIVDKAGRIAGYMVGPRNWGDPAAKRFLERLIQAP